MSDNRKRIDAFDAAVTDLQALHGRLGSSLRAFDHELRLPITEGLSSLERSFRKAASVLDSRECTERNFETLFEKVEAIEERLAAFEQVGPDRSWSEHIEFASGAEVVFGGQRFRLVDEVSSADFAAAKDRDIDLKNHRADSFATAGIDVQTSSDGSCTCGISIVEHPVDAHTRIRETLETAAAAYRFSLEITDDNDSARMARTADDLHAEARRLAGLEKTA